MKKQWNAPTLETLTISETMASVVYGDYTDEAYVPGKAVDKNNPKTWDRFKS